MPIAFETCFGWVLAGSTDSQLPIPRIATCHVSCNTGDELLRKFWEIEDSPLSEPAMSPEERCAVQHFKTTQSRTIDGRFVVPLPKRTDVKGLGESRSHAVQRFLSLERNLRSKNQFNEFRNVMREYFDLKHAELVPYHDLNKPAHDVFYLPVHVVCKPSSTTTKFRAVFDASAKSSSGVSLNDTLMVGPTVHASLIEVLLRFRMHRIAVVADVSKMYRAIELTDADRDLHRFVWRESPEDTLQDYRMTRLTFGISSSSFIANMAVKQNAEDYTMDYPLAAKVVEEAFYVDDCLTGADSVQEGLKLRRQLQELFAKAGFTLRKWNSSNPQILRDVPPELRDEQTSLTITEHSDVYSKTLGIEWHCVLDYFRINTTKQYNHTTSTTTQPVQPHNQYNQHNHTTSTTSQPVQPHNHTTCTTTQPVQPHNPTTSTTTQPVQPHNHTTCTTTQPVQPHNPTTSTTTQPVQPHNQYNLKTTTTCTTSQPVQPHNHTTCTTTQPVQPHNPTTSTTTQPVQPHNQYNLKTTTTCTTTQPVQPAQPIQPHNQLNHTTSTTCTTSQPVQPHNQYNHTTSTTTQPVQPQNYYNLYNHTTSTTSTTNTTPQPVEPHNLTTRQPVQPLQPVQPHNQYNHTTSTTTQPVQPQNYYNLYNHTTSTTSTTTQPV